MAKRKMVFFIETFDPETDLRIFQEQDNPIEGTVDFAESIMACYFKEGENHWTHSDKGEVTHFRLVEAPR